MKHAKNNPNKLTRRERIRRRMRRAEADARRIRRGSDPTTRAT